MSQTQHKNEDETQNSKLKTTPSIKMNRLWWISTAILVITIGRDVLISPPQWDSLNDKFSAIGYFIWILLSVSILLYEKHKQSNLIFADGILGLVIAVLSFIPVWRTEEVVWISAIVLAIFLLLTMLLSYKKPYLIEGTILGGILRFLLTIVNGFKGIGATFQSVKNGSEKGKRKRVLISVLVGLLLSLPWVLIFLSLFSSADAVFQNRLEQIFEIISLEFILRIFGNLFWLVAFSVLLFGYFSNLKTEETKIKKPTVLGNIETLIVLGIVVLIFFSFIMVQFRYFFAGEMVINIDGYTYAEYVRRGTTELIFASVLAIAMVQLLKFFKKESSPTANKIFKTLYGVLIAEIGIVLVSAFQRLRLLENTYGVTSTRLIGHVFMITMAIFLIVLFLDELFSKKNHLLLLMSTWAVVFVFTIAIINMPATAVQTNQMVHGDAGVDWYYLRSLPDEGVPALIESIAAKDFDATQMGNIQNQAEFEKVLAELSCREFEVANLGGTGVENSRWYWRIDQIKALDAIIQNNHLWAKYPVQIDDDECAAYASVQECFANESTKADYEYYGWEVFYVHLENMDEEALQEQIEFFEQDEYYQSMNEEEYQAQLEYTIQQHTRYYCDFYDYRGW